MCIGLQGKPISSYFDLGGVYSSPKGGFLSPYQDRGPLLELAMVP
jgi:hypothetical protein